MKSSSFTLVGSDEAAAAVARAAGAALSPPLSVAAHPSLAGAEAAPTAGGLLVLLNPAPADVQRAAAALDPEHLPRWAVVVFGEVPPSAPAEAIARGEWSNPLVARVFRSALAGHALRRENARFRGDLKTIGIRVAHDLRAPLSGILTSAEVLKEILAESAPDDAGLARTVVESADDLKRLILQMSLIAKGSAHLSAFPLVDMGQAVEPAAARLEGKAAKKGIQFTRPAQWPQVAGDLAWLDQIWTQLLANALAHAGATPIVALGWAPEGDELHFWVRDQGQGVAAEKRPLLFQPFHVRHHPSSARGLGLALVERLVFVQGGRCGYACPIAGGSVFSFWLPAPPAAAA